MKRIILKVMSTLALLATTGCVALVFVGCQTRVTWEKNPETALPIQQVVEVNGVQQLATTGYQMAGGGWEVTARSPLWAKEQFSGFSLSLGTNGEISVALNTYDRDLSTNAVVLTKTIFDGSANLALAVAKAYATIQTGGATDAGGILESLTAEGLSALKAAIANKTNGTITLKKKDGTTTTATCKDDACTFEDGTTVTAEDCANCTPK